MKANLLLALVASLSAAPAQEVNTFTAHLTGAAVVPPSATPVAGKGTFYLTGNGLGSHLFILHLGQHATWSRAEMIVRGQLFC